MRLAKANSYDRQLGRPVLRRGLRHHFARRAKHVLAVRKGHMEIADWRKQIDALDEQIVALLNQRAAAAMEIGKLKAKVGAPIYEPSREQTVFEHVAQVNPGPLSAAQLQDVYYRVMDVMRSLQRVDTHAGTGSNGVGATKQPAAH